MLHSVSLWVAAILSLCSHLSHRLTLERVFPTAFKTRRLKNTPEPGPSGTADDGVIDYGAAEPVVSGPHNATVTEIPSGAGVCQLPPSASGETDAVW